MRRRRWRRCCSRSNARETTARKAVAERAPYGRGVETLVDSSVRACWQIDAAQVTVGGGVWRDTLAQIVAHAATGLGCPPEHTEAHLYKLLVYEAGGFFAAHRDTEKVDGMVATLVLSLPVAGAGGELVISHKQRQTRVDLRTEEPSELAFAAFYADCIHETLPVSAGHRIVLVYLLVLQQGAAADALRTAPDYTAQEARIAAQLREWDTGPVDGSKLVWLLEHDYSTAGLSFDRLKNADAAVGGALARAARQAGHSLHAAILHIEEHGIAVDTGDYIDWDKPESSWEMEEVFHSELWLDGWVAPDDTKRDYGRVPLLPGELVPAGALEDAEPDDEQVNVTGNEGVELSHSYRRAALVLWPERDTVRTLAHGGIGGAVAYVADELAHPRDQADAAGPARALVAQLIDAWPAPRRAHPYRRHGGNGSQSCADALRLLHRLGDETTTRRFLHEIATAHYSGNENAELLEAVAAISPASLHGWLPEFSAAVLPRHPEAALDFLRRLCEQAQSWADGARRTALRDAARAACNALPEIVGSDARPDPAADLVEDSGYLRSDTSAERIGELQCPRNPLSVRTHLALRVGRGGRGGGSVPDPAPPICHPGAGHATGAGGVGETPPAQRRGGARRVRCPVAACCRLSADAQRAPPGGTQRLGDRGCHLLYLSQLSPPEVILRRPGGNHATSPVTERAAPARSWDHRRQRARHDPRDRTQRPTLHAGLH